MTTWNDAFPQANESPLSSSGKWSAPRGNTYCCKVVSNKVVTNAQGNNCPARWNTVATAQQFSQITAEYPSVSWEVAPMVRINNTNGNTGYLALFFNDGNLYLYRKDGDENFAAISTTAFTVGASPVVAKAVADGSAIKCYWRGALVKSSDEATYDGLDGSNNPDTMPGMNTWGTESYTLWEGGDGTAPATGILRQMMAHHGG